MRLAEGADRLSLQIDGGEAVGRDSLPEEVHERLQALDASLRIAVPQAGRRRMLLTIPVRELAEMG